ncbi:hypothetical protein B484DRAFT_445669, partial [Ochromonadaceae sp. CCMP2298]
WARVGWVVHATSMHTHRWEDLGAADREEKEGEREKGAEGGGEKGGGVEGEEGGEAAEHFRLSGGAEISAIVQNTPHRSHTHYADRTIEEGGDLGTEADSGEGEGGEDLDAESFIEACRVSADRATRTYIASLPREGMQGKGVQGTRGQGVQGQGQGQGVQGQGAQGPVLGGDSLNVSANSVLMQRLVPAGEYAPSPYPQYPQQQQQYPHPQPYPQQPYAQYGYPAPPYAYVPTSYSPAYSPYSPTYAPPYAPPTPVAHPLPHQTQAQAQAQPQMPTPSQGPSSHPYSKHSTSNGATGHPGAPARATAGATATAPRAHKAPKSTLAPTSAPAPAHSLYLSPLLALVSPQEEALQEQLKMLSRRARMRSQHYRPLGRGPSPTRSSSAGGVSLGLGSAFPSSAVPSFPGAPMTRSVGSLGLGVGGMSGGVGGVGGMGKGSMSGVVGADYRFSYTGPGGMSMGGMGGTGGMGPGSLSRSLNLDRGDRGGGYAASNTGAGFAAKQPINPLYSEWASYKYT